MSKKTSTKPIDEEVETLTDETDVSVDEENSEEETVTITVPADCRLTENSISQLDMLLDFAHPRQINKDLIGVLLNYLRLENEPLPPSFRETAENYMLIFQWLDIVEQEMDEAGFDA